MGVGMIITGLAALIIGESAIEASSWLRTSIWSRGSTDALVRPRWFSFLPWFAYSELASAFLGSIIYFLIIATCLRLGLPPTDLRLATGLLVIAGISIRFRSATTESYIRGRL